MARTRSLKPGFFTNDSLAEVEPLGRLLFQGLWCIADRAGRLEERQRRIKAEILPYDDTDIDRLLTELSQRGFIIRYAAGDVRYIQVTNFTRHQYPNKNEKASTIPAPEGYVQVPPTTSDDDESIAQSHPESSGTSTVLVPDDSHTSTVLVRPLTVNRLPLTVKPSTVYCEPVPPTVEDVPPAAAPAETPQRPAPSVEETPLQNEPVPGKAQKPASEQDRKTPPTAAPPPAPSDRPSVLPIRKPSRFQDVLDAVANAGITLHHTSRDAAAVKSCSAAPALIAEAYVAAATGDWGDAWMLSNLSLTTICQRIPAYEAWKHGVTSKQPARASPGRSGRGLSIQELARMGGST